MPPSLSSVRRVNGIAGQFSISADATYPSDPVRTVTFVGSVYGGPVVMLAAGVQTPVTDPGRFGAFGEDWVRKFYSWA